MSHDLVSVILPTFNRASCVTQAIDSALTQSHRSVEIIVVDDGSTDCTREMVARLYSSEPRVKYIWQENRGVSAARNVGLRAAQGRYVALLDSDDYWKPWKIELQIACLDQRPDAGMIWTDIEAVDGQGRLLHSRYLRILHRAYGYFGPDDIFPEKFFHDRLPHPGWDENDRVTVQVGDIYSKMIMGNLVLTSTVLLRRERCEQVGSFDESLKLCGADYNFHLRTCREGPVAYIDVASSRYRCGGNDQLSGNTLMVARNFLKTITEAIERDRERITLTPSMLKRLHAGAHAWIGEAAGAGGHRQEARQQLARSLAYNPLQVRVFLLLALNTLPLRVTQPARELYRTARRSRDGSTRAGAP